MTSSPLRIFVDPISGEVEAEPGGSGGGGGGGGTCANSPQLLCRAGRTGTTNDATISSDAYGTLSGTAASGIGVPGGVGLMLNSTTKPDIGNTGIFINQTATTITGSWLMLGNIASLTLNDDVPGGLGSSILGFIIAGAWTVGDDSQGGPQADFFLFAPQVSNPTGVSKVLARAMTVVQDNASFNADSAACTIGHYRGHHYSPTFSASGMGGAITVTDPDHALVALHSEASVGVGVSVPQIVGFQYDNTGVNSTTVVDNIAIQIDDGGQQSTGIFASMRCRDARRNFRHIGSGVFGADADPTNISVGLEVQSTTLAFLVSRMTTTQRNALTPVNGMLIYNTTDDKFQGYEAGAWTNLI